MYFSALCSQSSSVEKKYSILRTAVYRASRERKHKATIKEEGVCFGNVYVKLYFFMTTFCSLLLKIWNSNGCLLLNYLTASLQILWSLDWCSSINFIVSTHCNRVWSHLHHWKSGEVLVKSLQMEYSPVNGELYTIWTCANVFLCTVLLSLV